MPPKKKKMEVVITEVSRSMGVTVNCGDYESARYDVGMTARIPEGMDLKEANKQISSKVINALDTEYGDMAEMATKLLKEQ